MLGRKLTGSASFVCLRCRRLLVGAPQRLPPPALAFLPSSRTHRRSVGSHAGLTGPGGPSDDQFDRQDNVELGSEPSTEPDDVSAGHSEDFGSHRPPSTPLSPQQRTYKSRGHFLSPVPEGLSVDILGKPGSAIVLREKRALSKKPRSADPLRSDDDHETSVSPASLLPDETADETSEDVLLNIHELKPKETRILTDKQFRKLKRTLIEGFTSSQLESYLREHEQTLQFAQEETGNLDETPWILEREPWVPLVQAAGQDVEPRLEGYVHKAMAPKERLAVRLMRQCWDVLNQKVLDQDGYLSIKLRDVEFSLLTLGNRRWLEGTPRAILARVKQVKLIRETRTVSIVAPKHTADSILDRINRVLSNARTSDFPVDLASPKPLEPSILEEVGRLTNTVTRLDPSGNKVVVTWIHMPERDENFENAAETVLRFLRDAYGPKARMSSALQIVPSDLAKQGRYIGMLNYAQKLPWQERFEKWERWTAALSYRNSESDAPASIPADILAFPLDGEAAAKVPETEQSTEHPPDWSLQSQTDTSAVFGHVVFTRQKQPSVPGPAPESTSQLDPSLPRTFLPTLPALGSLNLPTNLHEEGLWHSIVVIRFAPSPDIAQELITSAPGLELRIEADHRELKRLVSLRAITETFTGDVLFPAAAVDTRLVQQRYFTLPGAGIEHHVPAIITFLSKSNLRPWDGKLSTPPVLLGVRLPRRLFPSTFDATHTGADGSTDLIQVDYALASIEVQRTVTAAYSGLKLRYTSIQGGQRGGERAEISLDAVRVPEGKGEDASSPGEPDLYEIVDEADVRRPRFISHTIHAVREKAAQRAAPAKPVELAEFIRVAP
ncbi:550a54fb-33ab-4d36-ac77-174c6cc8d2aa [Thermothielavioides terrestris]|uniref:550a54fb-33ab-4d36-ac77-174c6cc8d2aa n=1 Tax=Thermothielavioides terrestris TaxID=2587410 RepID=A0A3S4BGU7_9PEZI|nr:550a54fb-33ab-4d36-ac77-174c6cc8d2aa [Thermothielavioides terrestris]